MNYKEKFKIVIQILVLFLILAGIYNWSEKFTSTVSNWLISIAISVILTGISGEIIESVSGDFLKKIFLMIEYENYKFSVSLFVILTLILRYSLFHQ